jgi:hypothetical protein
MTPEQITEERSRRLKSAFIDQDFGGAKSLLDDNAFGGVVEDKEAFLTSSAVAGWAGVALGRRVNPAAPDWQGVKDGIARGFFKNQSASNVSDEDMFGMIASDYQAQDKVASAARMAAARGESWLGKFRELETKESGNMIPGRMANYIGLARAAHDEMAAKVAPYRSTIKTVAEMARNIDTAPDGMDWGAMARELIKVPKEDRPYVLEALSNQAAGEMGDIAAVQSLAKSFDRGLSRYLDSAASSVLGVAMSDIEASAADNPFLTGAQSGEVAAASSTLGDYMDLRDDVREIATGKLAQLKAVKFAGLNISGAVENIPMTMGSFIPYAGAAVTLASFQRSTYNEIRRSNPTMSREDANRIATISAPIQAITEIASDRFLFGKLPNLKRAFTQPIFSATGALSMFTTRAAIGTAMEVSEEFIQGVTPLAVQSISKALSDDIPGSDWKGFFSDFADNMPELISTILPLAIVGAGTGQLSDFRAGRQMARSTDMLIAAQYSPESAARISELANAGKWSEAEGAMRIDWAKINAKGADVSQVKATAQQRLQASERLKALQKEQVNASELLTTSPDYTASVTRTPTGWQVTTGEGTIIPVESAEAARRIAVDLRQVGSQQEADALVQVIDDYYAAGKQAETVFTGEDVKGGNAGVFGVRRDANGAVIATRAFNAKAVETIRAEAETAGINTETRGIFAHINGSNEIFPMRVADTAKGILRRMSLYQSQKDGQPQIFTFLHEDIESKFMLGLADGAWTEQDVRAAFKALAPAFANVQKPELKAGQTMSDAMEAKLSEYTWIENVRKLANGEGDATMLRETFSEMYVRNAYALDRRGRPTGLPAGSISRALESAVMGANTQEEASAFKRILAMFRAFSAYLKAVFGTVDAITKARDSGKIGEDWDAFSNKVLGIDEVKQMEGQAIDEAKAIMEAGNMPFSISPVSTISVPTSDIDTIPEDLARAEADMKAGGKDWAAEVDLSQPVGVYRGENGRLKLFDGHHRWLAARERGEPLQVRESMFGRATPIGEAPVVANMPDGAQLVGPATFSIQAYHGTPHKLQPEAEVIRANGAREYYALEARLPDDVAEEIGSGAAKLIKHPLGRFRLAKIGTGEGAQAYGWGLYFAENRKVGEQYRDELSRTVVPDEIAAKSAAHAALAARVNAGEDVGIAADKLRGLPWNEVRAARDEIAKLPTTGNLYTVELLPDEADFLDWDKPLSEQSDKVKAALRSTGMFTERDLNPPANFSPSPLFNSGRGAYDILKSNEESDRKASELLASLGIAGMKYFDGNSRNIEFGTRNYVIFDESLIKILEENGRKVEGQSFSISPITPAQDAEYLAAVESGDMTKAQAMADEAAKKARLKKVWRKGSVTKPGEGGFHFGTKEQADSIEDESQKSNAYFIKASNPVRLTDYSDWSDSGLETQGYDLDENAPIVYLNRHEGLGDSGAVDPDGNPLLPQDQDSLSDEEFLDANPSAKDSFIIRSSSQIKSADPVTYDESGQVIPLSQRFNPETPNINFSISPIRNLNELSDQVERQFKENPVAALEVKSRMIRQFAKISDKWSNERWTPQGNKIRPISEKRTVKSLDKEQAMRQAQREVELVNEGMDNLTPETLMAYSEGVGTLEDDPLIKKMLHDNGRLMSKATAEREGRNIKDQYDDAGWIPPQWYSNGRTIKTVVITRKDGSSESFPSAKVPAEIKAAIKSGEVKVKINKVTIPAVGGIMPDVMANNLGFDTASEMWAALESSIKSHRNVKEGYAKAEAAVKAVEKAAFEQARQEAQQWRDEADAMQKEDWSPKESLVRDLITLEAIRAMFPQEIRDKIGGFVALARKASESARLKVLQKQLERGQVLLEKHLKEQYGEATDKLLKRYQSQKDASGRITGKIISTATEQVDYAAEFIKLSIEDQADREAALEKKIETSDTAEEVQDALTKLGIARLFEVWDTKDSAARESAFNWLADTIEQGKLGKKILDEERKSFLTDMRQSAQSSILQGDKLSPDVALNVTNLDKGVMKRALLGMRGVLSSSLWTTLQRLELIFGEDSKTLNYFAERIINAANLSTDIKRMVEAQKKEALSIIFNSDSKYAHARGIAELQKVKQSGITTRKVTKEEIKLDLETLTKLNDGTMTAEAAGLRQDEADAALEEFANNGRKSTVTVERVTDAGTPVKRMMSETQGIQWWLWSMQDVSRKQMERDGWDADSFAQLEEFLSPEAKALARWIANSYSVDAPSLIDPVYRKLLNAPLPRTKNYSPMIRRNINTGGDVMDMEASDMNSGLAASFVKARVNSTAPLVETDALALFLAHWENVAHWVSHAELMRDMKAVLLDKDTAVAIRQKKSEGYLQRLKEDVKTIESNGTSTARELVDISRMWRWFMQFRAYKGLAFRISPIIKQTPAMLNPLLADVPAHNYMMGMARAFMEPKAFANEVSAMWSSDIIRRRIESGFSAESRVAMQGTSMTGSQAILAMQAGMMPMQMVDGGWTALGAAISFDYYRRGYMRDNPQMTPEIADSKAIARVEKMIATSAQPSDIYARSLRERSGNLFMRGLAMFVSETRKTLAIELMAIRRLATGKSKNKALDIQRFLVAHFVMAGVSQLSAMVIASLLGDDEDRDREWSVEQWTLALALGPVNGMFVFGKLIDRGGRFLINSDFYQERFGTGHKLSMFPDDNLSEKAFTDVYKAVVNVNDLFNPEDPDDFMNEIDNVSSAVGAAASTFFGPAGGAVDVGANVIREARKVQKKLSD